MPFDSSDASKDPELKDPELLAWIGEDELGSGKIGIKQAIVPAGRIPIVGVIDHKTKLTWPAIVNQFQRQANEYGKEIRLVRYQPVEILLVVRPNAPKPK